jgi:hypothetical protein
VNRRGFFAKIGAASVAVAAAGAGVAAERPDRFTHKGYTVAWTGWQRPPNQNITFGTWVAFKSGSNRYRYLTTMGSGLDHMARDMDVQDLAWMRGEWPAPWELAHATEAERARVKQLACRRLLERL